MQKWPDLVGPHTCIESPSKLLPSGRAEIRKCSGPRAPWGKSCKSICDWPHPRRRPNKSRRTRSALSNRRSGVTNCIPFWFLQTRINVKSVGFLHSHLSKRSSDLKQNGTQGKTPFSSTVFHTLSHGVIRFVASVSSRNHLLAGWNS